MKHFFCEVKVIIFSVSRTTFSFNNWKYGFGFILSFFSLIFCNLFQLGRNWHFKCRFVLYNPSPVAPWN